MFRENAARACGVAGSVFKGHSKFRAGVAKHSDPCGKASVFSGHHENLPDEDDATLLDGEAMFGGNETKLSGVGVSGQIFLLDDQRLDMPGQDSEKLEGKNRYLS